MIEYIKIKSLNKVESEATRLRFWSKVIVSDNEACWKWNAFIDKNGYGLFRIAGKNIRSNRLAYFLHNGIDPGQLVVCHSCDNPSCCNPSHLFLGTHKDNINDCWRKGRKLKTLGTRNGMAKYTEEIVRQVLDTWSTGKFKYKSDVGRLFGMSQSVASVIINRKQWPHVKRNK